MSALCCSLVGGAVTYRKGSGPQETAIVDCNYNGTAKACASFAWVQKKDRTGSVTGLERKFGRTAMLRNVLLIATTSGLPLFSKEFLNAVSQPRLSRAPAPSQPPAQPTEGSRTEVE